MILDLSLEKIQWETVGMPLSVYVICPLNIKCIIKRHKALKGTLSHQTNHLSQTEISHSLNRNLGRL